MSDSGVTTFTNSAAGLEASGQPRIVGQMMLEDSALMMRYQEGDLDSFQQLYERHKGGLYRYFMRHTGHPDIASDLFQEVWSRIVRYRANYRPIARFNTYLYRIAHNCLMDHGRSQVRQSGTFSLSDAVIEPAADTRTGPREGAEHHEIAGRLKLALMDIPAEQRDSFLLRHEAGLNLDEIAHVTGVNRETAKSRLRYAVKRLRRLLDDEDPAIVDNKTEKAS